MSDSTRESERIMGEARQSLAVQRAGGLHRAPRSIGRGSAALKSRHLAAKLRRILMVVAGIVFAAMVGGIVLDGIGTTGVLVVLMAVVAAVVLFSAFPKMEAPRRADLNKGDVKQMVGRTELWLERQRPALPPPAANLVDQIGVQLDALGLQLEGIDQNHPAAREVRTLVGETLPGMVDSYRKIPDHLRREERAGATPDQQITESLGKISAEIDHVTRQLASGALDDLAVKTRYLDYKYGDADPAEQEP
ncbi:MAG: hypothetical protein ACTHK5_13820 [Tsuneonella sp.]